ncbi:MAG: M20/M25/M40 family metallo-hydrolase [Actinomycetota bacterium]|nr:M20/M25/M40 family metallo-hydrolase [Actinomycetota bacterium]
MSVREVVERNAERYVGWLQEACSISSMASDRGALADMATWLQSKFDTLGATTQRLTYETAPEMLLARLGSGPRCALIYDHYDVQPVDPIELWQSNPFAPEVRDGKMYARGVADNKGDLVARLAGLELYRELHGEPSVEVKFLVEGEEETGSRSFPGIVARYGNELAADGCIWEGAGIDHIGRPEIVFGAKGLAYVELTHRGLAQDQHSSVAVVAPSPVWHLVEALSTLRDPDGTVLIDGFYDDVRAPDEEDEKLLAALPFEEEREKRRLGVSHFVGGASGVDLVRRLFFAPTCNIAGIVAGFIVPGTSKTVLPKEAMAKVDMRLVPDQDPDDIVAKLRRHLAKRGFGDIEIGTHSMEHPVRSPATSSIGQAALAATEGVFTEAATVAPMMIGTGPMYPIASTLGIPTVSPAGVSRPDSDIHAPNENCRIEDFLRVIEYTVGWLKEFSDLEAQ